MKRLVFRDPDYFDNSYDVQRIQSACATYGYSLDEWSARAAWEKYSSSMAASWMFLPDSDEDLFYTVRQYLEELEEDDYGL